jgi:hypothetical protein
MGFFSSIGNAFKSVGSTIVNTGKGVLGKVPFVNQIPGIRPSGGDSGGDSEPLFDFDFSLDPETREQLLLAGGGLIAGIIIYKILMKALDLI